MAVPLMIGTFVQSVVMITDSAFISRLGVHEYDAVGNAGVLYISIIMFMQGIADTGQIIIARRNGEKNILDVGKTFRHTITILFFVALILFLVYTFATSPFLNSSIKNPTIASYMDDFLHYRKFGVLFEAFRLGIIAYYIGIGRTRVIIYSTLILAIGNIFLDYCLIFGHFNFPALGVQGAAIASVSAEILSLIFLIVFLILDKQNLAYQLTKSFKWSPEIFEKFKRLSPPLMIQGFMALSAWYLFFSMIEYMGPEKLEISHVIRNLYFIAFIPLYGFGATTKTYVSNLLGGQKQKEIPQFLFRVIVLNTFFLVVFMHGIILYPDILIGIINKNEELIQNPEVFNQIREIFILISGSMLLFGFISPFFNAVSGTGNTRASMLIEMSSIAIYLIASYIFIYLLQFDLFGVWSVEYIYFGTLGLFSILYLKFANWNKSEV